MIGVVLSAFALFVGGIAILVAGLIAWHSAIAVQFAWHLLRLGRENRAQARVRMGVLVDEVPILSEGVALTYRQTGTAGLWTYIWHWRSSAPLVALFFVPVVIAGVTVGWMAGTPLTGVAWAVGLMFAVAALRGAVFVWRDERRLADPTGRNDAVVVYNWQASEWPQFPWPPSTDPAVASGNLEPNTKGQSTELADPSWTELWVDRQAWLNEHVGEQTLEGKVLSSVEVDHDQVLDMREVEGDPFHEVTTTLDNLDEEETLLLIISSDPVFLYQHLSNRGFTHETRQISGQRWHVTITAETA